MIFSTYIFAISTLLLLAVAVIVVSGIRVEKREKTKEENEETSTVEHYISLLFFSVSRPYYKVTKREPAWHKRKIFLLRAVTNPIIGPREENLWESWQTFNPAAVSHKDKVHFLYRALGPEGISRLGYAMSSDGIHIDEREKEPVYAITNSLKAKTRKYLRERPYASGGDWAGCEDPRITKFGDMLYLLYVAFDKVGLPRIAITSIRFDNFLNKRWKWGGAKVISPPGVIDKSGVLFPEKINGKYVIMHRIFPNILIDFLDDLNFDNGKYLEGKYSVTIRENNWDSRKIGAGAPPIKTKHGWLLIYYAVDDKDDTRYKIGAMILDLKNPSKVLHRTNEPILEPDYWYENRGHKAGVAYPCGAVVLKGRLLVYYGGSDSYVCVASTPLKSFLVKLMSDKPVKLKKVAHRGAK